MGFVVFLNCATVYWFPKKQTACEISSFGSEYIDMKQCCDYLKVLRYKLIMMVISVNSPCFVYGDKQSVLWNTSVPGYTLNNKTCSVTYHYVR